MLFSPFLQDAGIWYLFHRVATGDSHSLGIETKSELTPLGIFYNNRVHSNFKVMQYAIKKKKSEVFISQYSLLELVSLHFKLVRR